VLNLEYNLKMGDSEERMGALVVLLVLVELEVYSKRKDNH
jgi:hypothetical protein